MFDTWQYLLLRVAWARHFFRLIPSFCNPAIRSKVEETKTAADDEILFGSDEGTICRAIDQQLVSNTT